MKCYLIKKVFDCPNNLGNPEVDKDLFRTKAQALKAYKKAVKAKNTQHGKKVRIELYKTTDDGDDEELLFSQELASEKLPRGAVIVTCKHIRIDCCYEVTDIRFANEGERYEDLHVDERCTGSKVDKVFTLSSLCLAYELGYGFFTKIQKGSEKIECFLEAHYDAYKE